MELYLVKIDANAGRSGVWGFRAFRKGVHNAGNVSQEDADKLATMFERFYGAKPERAARAEHPELFEEKGPYNVDHPVLGPRDLRREGVQPAQGAPADVGGDAAPAPGPEREQADAGGGHERPAPDRGQLAPGDERVLTFGELDDDGSIEVSGPGFDEVVVAQAPDLAQTDIDLAEAVGRLDPEAEGHWTPQGFPNLEALKDLVGHRVTRREVDAVAKGYNRAGARAAKE